MIKHNLGGVLITLFLMFTVAYTTAHLFVWAMR